MNGTGYILKAIAMQQQQPLRIWELGFTWFLGFYTLGAMFSPLVAYAIMFHTLLKNKHFRQRYVWASIFLSPIVGPIR